MVDNHTPTEVRTTVRRPGPARPGPGAGAVERLVLEPKGIRHMFWSTAPDGAVT
ncbi:hypothetical protein [Streptomyces syringium]|uniref:hypothetical protein n=1 Tax=Streptomyces syringium TaxID=76729 RepID=UPI0033D15047